MPKLLIATTNQGKTKEYKDFLRDLNLEIVSLNNVGRFKPVDETGQTFKQNAILKAKGYFSQFKFPVLADDGGLEIDILNKEPGVRSHRWLGYEASDKELVKQALKRLTGIPKKQRTARIVTWVAFYNGKNLFLESGAIEGYIVEKMPDWIEKGFPWRSILFIPKFNKLYQELTPEEHQKINHRKKILKRLRPKIKKALKI